MTGAAVGSDDLIIEGVDNGDGRGLYTPNTVRRRLGAMTRLRSSSLIFGDQHPISVGGLGFDGSPGDPGRGPLWGPGCLTSESEERETWTAGSLRTVSLTEQSVAARSLEETSAVHVSRSTL